MGRTEFKNDRTKALEEAEGTDGRVNVSSRTASRGYYNSKDEEECYTVVWTFADASAAEFCASWKNLSKDKVLVISSIGINAEVATRFKLHFVTGTASGGNAVTPTNLNKHSSSGADSASREGGTEATGIADLTSVGVVDFAYVEATGHEEFRLDDQVRLGQNDGIAIEVFEIASGADVSGVIFGYFESA